MEDNCDSFGSTYNNQFTGTFGDISTLSFYPAHHITTGEGGAVVTNNPKLKKLWKVLEIGEEIVIVHQVKIILVRKDITGNLEDCHMGMIISIFIQT